MKILKALGCLLLFSALAFGQATRPKSCSLANGGTCNIGNANGAYGASFEEIPVGSPSGVTVTIQGCMQAATCDSAADTNTATSATVRGVTFSKVYDYFLVTATLTGGSSPTITINSLITTANNHKGTGGGGCIATASTLTATCGTVKGTVASITDGSTTSDCTVGGGTNVVVCQYTGSAWAFAGNSGSAPTYAQVTTGTNTGQTFTTGSGGTLNTSGTGVVDFSVLGTFKVPSGAGATATATKMLAFDSTAGALHAWNGADAIWPLTKAAVSHNFLTSFTQSTGAFVQAQPAFTDISGTVTTAQLPGTGATTVNSQTCTLGSTCTIPEQVNTVNLTSQAGFNLLTSTANTIGVTVTPTNSATNQLKFEATGTVTIGGGGTGAVTAAAGFDALAPTTTRGDLIARGVSSNGRIAIGSNGSCLTSNGTDPLWGSCATGSLGGTGTTNSIAVFTAASTLGNSLFTDNATTSTYTGTGGFNLTAGPLKFTEIVAPTGGAGFALLYSDSTTHRLTMKNASNTATQVVASGVDINTSDQVTATHLAAALPVNQGGTGTTSTLTGLVRGSASAMTAAELSADVTTSGSNAATVVALRGAALPTLAASTGLLYDSAGTLSLPGTLPTAAMPALTGDATNSAGSLATTVVALRNATLPTLAASTGLLFDTSGTLSLPGTLPTSAMPALTGDVTNTAGSLATTVGKINGTAFAGVNGHIVSFGAANIPADSGLVAADEINYHTPANGIARTTAGSQAIAGTELSGDATTSGSNAVTVVKINGNSVPSGAAVHQTLVATGVSTLTWKTVPDCNGSSNALNYTQLTDLFSCLSIATLSNPMTTLGDMITGGSAGVVTRLAGPTAGNSPYTLSSNTSGTVSWGLAGVPVDSEAGATFTIQSDAQTTPDRATAVLTTNNTTSTAVTVPQAGSASMLNNFPFVHCNTGSVVATDTPTTSTINGNTAMKLVGAVATHNPECSFWWSDAVSTTGNWWGAEILPTDANGRLAAEGEPAFTGDVTKAAGSLATTVTALNGTAFSGTSGHLVGFGAANIPTDSGVVSANVVTAGSNFVSGNLVQAAASNKTTSDSGIATANVVTAASNYSNGGLVYAAAANKTTTNSADWAITSHTLSGGSAGILTSAANGAASVAAFNVTGTVFTGGTGTTTFPLAYFNQGTGPTTFSTAGTELGFNAPSGFTGNFLDFHVNGGASVAKLDSTGALTVASCTGCGGGGGTPAFPITVTGGVSGAIPYFSSTTVESVSALLAANALMVGGGAGTAPSTVTTGTGVVTALGVNTGTAGAFVVNGGALGTPSSGTLTNATGLPINGVVSATGAIGTIANGNNPLVINCALTSGTTCLTTGETTAATTSGAVEDQITTLTTTTAIPLQITQGAAGPANAAAPDLFKVSAAAAGGAAGASNAGSAGAAIELLTGAGSAGGATTGNGGAGGAWTMTQGAGGAAGGTATNNGGNGGGIAWTTGAGGNGGTGAATAGSGGGVTWTLGAPGTNSSTGTAGAVGLFNVTGNAPASTANTTGVNAGTLFQISGVAGGASSNAAGTAGIGSSPSLSAGAGGAGTGTNAVGGAGGSITFTAGAGGASLGTGANANGGGFTFTPGAAGTGGSGTAGKAGTLAIAGSNAGGYVFTQGSANTTANTNIAANSVILQAPAAVTAYAENLAGAAATGVRMGVNASSVVTDAWSGSFGAVSATGQTASISTATVCAATANTACGQAGQYRISFDIWGSGTACSSVTAGKVIFTLTWTDADGNAHTAVPWPLYDFKTAAQNVTGTFSFNTAKTTEGANGSMIISTNGTVIQYASTYTACTTGTGTYNVHITTEQLQ